MSAIHIASFAGLSLVVSLVAAGCSTGEQGNTSSSTSTSSTSGTGGTAGGDTGGGGSTSTSGTGGDGGTAGQGGSGGAPECTEATECNDNIDCTVDTCNEGVCENATDNSVCDNTLYCDGIESCDPPNGDANTGCVAGTDPCDDTITCTTDSCDEDNDVCTNETTNSLCDDTLFCTGTEICDPPNGDVTTGCVVGTDPCIDAFSCTVDSCDDNNDSCTNVATNSICDDTLFCTGSETCDPQNGDPNTGCVAGTDPCVDAYSCTVDTCDDNNDSCTNVATNSICDDTLFCTGSETCDPQNGDPNTGCVAGSDPCIDAYSCTVDSCDDNNDSCTNAATNSLCDNTLYCDGTETCDPQNGDPNTGCAAGTTVVCDDSLTCTTDFCDENGDTCQSVPINANCDNGLFCDGVESCDPQNGAQVTGCLPGTTVNCDDGFSCTGDSCDETNDVCAYQLNHGTCDNTVFCDGAEICDPQNGVAVTGCLAGNAVICDDGLGCTSDVCDNQQQDCVVTPNDQACDDTLYCNGLEYCDVNAQSPGTGCAAGTTVVCTPDSVACTDEICNNNTQICDIVPNNGFCQSGEFCHSLIGCTNLTACTTDPECDDGDYCNGAETCDLNLNVCQVGTAIDCNDTVGCTIDSCDETNDVCLNVESNGACDDGFVCNGVETCDVGNGDPVTGCLMGTAIVCDDGFGCTVDQCEEPNGTCNFIPQNGLCADSVFCNGVETCDPTDPNADPTSGCLGGSAPNCADTVFCTVDSCDANLDNCIHMPDNSLCTGTDTCDPILDCGDYCIITTCLGKTYECGDCIDNDGDLGVDTISDLECFGPCDNNEDGFKGEIPGQDNAPCKHDCYFDGDSGAGNDDCFWTHSCDPLSVAPDYPPAGSKCEYDPNSNIVGTSMTCAQALVTQSLTCLDVCGPLQPNGCDCFGCCEIPNVSHNVFLGSEDSNGNGSCTTADLANPLLCKPCTIVTGCFNPCGNCEICIGKPTLPPECLCQECPPGADLCGPPCGGTCAFGYFCNNGCCVMNPG